MQYRAEIRTNDTTHHAPLADATTPAQAEEMTNHLRWFMQGEAISLDLGAGVWLVIPTREIRYIRVAPVEVTES